MTRSTSDLVDLFSERSTAVAFDASQPLARFLRETRCLFGGDLDKALIMLVIMLRASQHPEFRKLEPTDLEGADPPAIPSLGTNVRSLADSTGIPNESVRRKVLALIKAGWVRREGHTLHYSLEGYRAIAPAREALMQMYVRAYEIVGRLVQDADDKGTASPR